MIARLRRPLLLALAPLALAGTLLHGCSPATNGPSTNATPDPLINATLGETKTLAFTMKKWEGPDGDLESKKTAVNGTFPSFTVAMSKKASAIKAPADLSDLKAKVEVPLEEANVITGSNADAMLRNARIAEFYFEATKFAKAGFTLTNFQTTSSKTSFAPGDTLDVTADAELDLHGVKKTIPGLKLAVTLTEGACRIKSAEDLSIKSDAFQLPWQALLHECGHKGLDEAATVSFDVTLTN
ncbi:YceI family protein [bacterium]|nr:YceI family protein [bacterium]